MPVPLLRTRRKAEPISVYEAEGFSPLFEVFTPQEERKFAWWMVRIAALIGGIAMAAASFI